MPLIGDKDPEAFEVFYDRHGGVAYSLAYRIVGERGGRRRRHPGGLHLDLAQRRPLRPRPRQRPLVDARHRPQPGDRRPAQQGRAGAEARPSTTTRSSSSGPPASSTDAEALRRETAHGGSRRARRAARRAVEGDRAGLLRRLQPVGDRDDAGRAAGDREGKDEARPGEDPGTSWRRDWHERDEPRALARRPRRLPAGGAGARRRRRTSKRHLAGCEECRRRARAAAPGGRWSCRRRSSGSSRRPGCASRVMEEVRSDAEPAEARAARPRRRWGLWLRASGRRGRRLRPSPVSPPSPSSPPPWPARDRRRRLGRRARPPSSPASPRA